MRRYVFVIIVALSVWQSGGAPVRKRDVWADGLAQFLSLLSTTESPTTTTTSDPTALGEGGGDLTDDYFGIDNGTDLFYEQYLDSNELTAEDLGDTTTTKAQTTTKTSTTTSKETLSTTAKSDATVASVTTTSTTISTSTTAKSDATIAPVATSTAISTKATTSTDVTAETSSIESTESLAASTASPPHSSTGTMQVTQSSTKVSAPSTSAESPVTDVTSVVSQEKLNTTSELNLTSTPNVTGTTISSLASTNATVSLNTTTVSTSAGTKANTKISAPASTTSTAVELTTNASVNVADNFSAENNNSLADGFDNVTTARTIAGTDSLNETGTFANQSDSNVASQDTDETTLGLHTTSVTSYATNSAQITNVTVPASAVVAQENVTTASNRDMNITSHKPRTVTAGTKAGSPVTTERSATTQTSTTSLQNAAATSRATTTGLTASVGKLSTETNLEKTTLKPVTTSATTRSETVDTKSTTAQSTTLKIVSSTASQTPSSTQVATESTIKTSTSEYAKPETTSNELSARSTNAGSSTGTLAQISTIPNTASTSTTKITTEAIIYTTNVVHSSSTPVDFGWVFWNQDSEEADSTTTVMTTSTQGVPLDLTPSVDDRGKIPDNYDLYDWLPNDFEHSTPSTFVAADEVALAFFKLNWYWILIALVIVIIIFCVPGMLMQIYCHKFYIFYRREKDKSRADISISEEHTDSTLHENDEGGQVKTEAEAPEPTAPVEAAPAPETQDPDTGFSSGFPSPPDNAQLNAQPTPETHRVDVYTGPCSFPSLNNASCSAAQPVLQQPVAPPPPETQPSYMYPSLNYQYRLENPIPLVTTEPIVYSIPVKGATNAQGQNPGQGKTFGDEAIIDSNKTQRKARESSKDRPRLRVPKPAEYSAPARPPKPKQYRPDEPVPKSSNYRDYGRSGRGDRPWAERKRRPRPKEHARPKKIIVDNPRGNDYGTGSNPERRKKSKPQSGPAKEPRSREELLRQLIKGFNEAEMLQRKLDRTRRWTREQKSQQSKSNRRNGEGNSGAKNGGKSGTDKPPRYEDVMSDASKNYPTKSKRRSDGRRRAAK